MKKASSRNCAKLWKRQSRSFTATENPFPRQLRVVITQTRCRTSHNRRPLTPTTRRRNLIRKLVYSDTFIEFVFSRHTHCIRCGTARVRRQVKRDRVDWVSKHPFRLLFRLTGAPCNKCDACRLQYYDWRSPVPPA